MKENNIRRRHVEEHEWALQCLFQQPHNNEKHNYTITYYATNIFRPYSAMSRGLFGKNRALANYIVDMQLWS